MKRLEHVGGHDGAGPECDGGVDEGLLEHASEGVPDELRSEQGENGDSGVHGVVTGVGSQGLSAFAASGRTRTVPARR